MQHKIINITWDYWKFPRHPVAAEKFEIRRINSNISRYHYRVDPEVGKGVCVIRHIPCSCQTFVAQFDKYMLQTIYPSS